MDPVSKSERLFSAKPQTPFPLIFESTVLGVGGTFKSTAFL